MPAHAKNGGGLTAIACPWESGVPQEVYRDAKQLAMCNNDYMWSRYNTFQRWTIGLLAAWLTYSLASHVIPDCDLSLFLFSWLPVCLLLILVATRTVWAVIWAGCVLIAHGFFAYYGIALLLASDRFMASLTKRPQSLPDAAVLAPPLFDALFMCIIAVLVYKGWRADKRS